MDRDPRQIFATSSIEKGLFDKIKSANTLQDIVDYVEGLPAARKAEAQRQLLAAAEAYTEHVSEAAQALMDWTEKTEVWKTGGKNDKRTFEQAFPQVFKAAQSARSGADRKRVAREQIANAWGKDILRHPEVASIMERENSARALQAVAKAFPKWDDARSRLNRARVKRLCGGKVGTSNLPHLQTSDLESAKSSTAAELEPFGSGGQQYKDIRHLFADGPGFLLQAARDPQLTSGGKKAPLPAPPPNDPPSTNPQPGQPPPPPAGEGRKLRSRTITDPKEQPSKGKAPPVSPELAKTTDVTIRGSGSGPGSGSGRGSGSGGRGQRASSAEQIFNGPKALVKSPAPGDGPQQPRCKCSKSRTRTDVLLTLDNQAKKIKPHDEDTQMDLLGRFLEPYTGAYDSGAYCYQHTLVMGAVVGLNVKGKTHPTLLELLNTVWENSSNLQAYKAGRETYSLFRKTHRDPVPSDELGPYRFFALPLPTFHNKDLPKIARMLGMNKTQQNAWDQRGTINLSGIVTWWQSSGLLDIFKQEFDMYLWHQRMVNGLPNYGWLRSMVHSLGQQLMRQDPGYWLLYVLLRPDHAHTLVAYPYYAKYQVPGDKTAFRHIDLNVREMATGKGTNQIQGSVSLDDEQAGDCTELVPAMHKYIRTWAGELKGRGVGSNGRVERVTDLLLTKEDLRKFNTSWEDVPCKALQVRVTRPEIPHGAHGPAKNHRRTMLPWFCSYNPDGSLEVEEGGTWEDLSKANRDLAKPPLTPSGLPNRYAAIPYRFAAAVKLDGLGALSDAMMARRKHSDPEVALEIQSILNGTVEDWNKYIGSWRENAAKVVKERFQLVKKLEQMSFPPAKSFFKNQGDNAQQPAPDFAPADEINDDGDDGDDFNLEKPTFA